MEERDGGEKLITRGTASTATTDALDRLILLELRLGHAADTGGAEVGLLGLDATEAT